MVPRGPHRGHPPERMDVLYRDEHYIAVAKPAGIVVHRGLGARERAALQTVRDLVGQWVFPIHRLDRATHGALVFGLTSEAARRLASAFAAGAVEKHYLAVVRGTIGATGRIDYPLRDEDGNGELRDAVTEFQRLSTIELPIPVGRFPTARYSSVWLTPQTGRTHQLRRHMAHLRHPIVGDVRHGDGHHNRMFREQFGIHRLMLFARDLAFEHPFEARRIVIDAPIDPQAHDLLQRLGLADSPPNTAEEGR